MSSTAESTSILRFTVSDRLEHIAQITTFVPLAVTGLVQRYPGSGLSQGIITLLGGIESVRIIHRVFAAILMVAVVYHVGAIGYRRFVLNIPRSMGPSLADLRAAGQTLAYNLRRRDSRPPQGRYTFEEKIEYWSLVWGTVLMVVTGFLLWNPIAGAKILPGSFIPAARAAHGGEAVLAILAILVWHFYHVHLKHFNKSIFTGYMTLEEMESDHPLALTMEVADPPSPGELRHRRNRYVPLYSLGAFVLLIGIWLFVSFEDTAITTIEPLESPAIYAPIPTTTMPLASTTTMATTGSTVSGTTTTVILSTEDLTWAAIGPVFEAKCLMCHGEANQIAGLSLATFNDAIAGGNDGPGVVPGDPGTSMIVTIQEAGGHPGQLDANEIANLRAWIDAGAPEK